MIRRREHSLIPLALWVAAKAIFGEDKSLLDAVKIPLSEMEAVRRLSGRAADCLRRVEIPLSKLHALRVAFWEAKAEARPYGDSSFELLAAAEAINDRVRRADSGDPQAGGLYAHRHGRLVAVKIPLSELDALHAGIEEIMQGMAPCGDSI